MSLSISLLRLTISYCSKVDAVWNTEASQYSSQELNANVSVILIGGCRGDFWVLCLLGVAKVGEKYALDHPRYAGPGFFRLCPY